MSGNERKKMRTIQTLLLSLFILSLFSCQAPVQTEKLSQELMETDRAFSELSKEKGMNLAFETYCHEEGVLLRPGSSPIKGRNEVISLLEKSDDSAIQLTWDPLFANAAGSGDMGYTYGIYELKVKETGEVRKGTYVSIWMNGKEGWKFVLDSGNEGLGD
jgi:hypothetical protein